MRRNPRNPKGDRGFTLLELLVVIGIIGVLAAILLPAIRIVTTNARIATTEALIKRVGMALELYCRECAYYPPDYIAIEQAKDGPFTDIYCLSFNGDEYIPVPDRRAYPPEALYYYLAHGYLTDRHPMLRLSSRTEVMDVNNNAMPEIVDPWGRPLLYNRRSFPGFSSYYIYYNGGGEPRNNVNTYDLFSVGPDGQTSNDDLPDPGADLGIYCSRAIDHIEGGNKPDDIRNWTR